MKRISAVFLLCLLSLALAGWVDSKWVDGFYRGLMALAESAARTGVALIGGDLARTLRVTCDIVVAGTVPRGKARLSFSAHRFGSTESVYG